MIKGEHASLKTSQDKMKKTLVDIKAVSEELNWCASKPNDVISDLKVEKGSLKILNDEFKANVLRLETTLKATQEEVVQEVIEAMIGTKDTLQEEGPKQNTLYQLAQM